MRRHRVVLPKVLYVANVKDRAAVREKQNKKTGGVQATEVSANHSSDNSQTTKLVIQRSHDRNAKTLSSIVYPDAW